MRRTGITFSLALPLLVLFLIPTVGDAQPVKRPPRIRPGPAPVKADLSDEEALKKADLSADDAKKLIEYLKARTLTDTDATSISDIIKKFAADEFDERLKAMEEVEKFGPAAIGPLKAAERDPDPEIAYRAGQSLKRIEKVPHSQVAVAAVRALVKLKSKDAAAAMIGFLPMSDTDEVAEEIRGGLIALAVVDGKPEPSLIAALKDKSVLRRSAAYVALTEGGSSNERIRIKEAFPLVKEAVRKETDTDAKFCGLWSLLMTSREKEFVPDLIELIPNLDRGRIWQLEEFLLQLAGKGKPDARFGKTSDSLKKAQTLWSEWWTKSNEKLDLVKFDFKPRITGYTDIIEYDYRGYGLYRVVTLGPDLKEKVKIGNAGPNMLQYPSDVKKLSNGNYLIAEQNNNSVTERDSTGKVIKNTNVIMPLSLHPIPDGTTMNLAERTAARLLGHPVTDGGMIIVGRNNVIQYDKNMKELWSYQRLDQNQNQLYDIMCGCRMPNGDVVFVTNSGQGGNCFRLQAKEVEQNGNKKWEVKLVGKQLALGRVGQFQCMDATGDDKILLCEANRVVEYDLKGDNVKELWSHRANHATSCQRLPNGNTLIAEINVSPNGKIREIEPSGEVVWEYESKDGLRAARAYRR